MLFKDFSVLALAAILLAEQNHFILFGILVKKRNRNNSVKLL